MNPTVCIKLHMDMEYSITLMQKCSHMLNFFAKKKVFHILPAGGRKRGLWFTFLDKIQTTFLCLYTCTNAK